MPANFTHYLFGQQLIPLLPASMQKTIQDNQKLYQIGQHGPDIIFYHRPFLPHSVARIGFQMHKLPARYFFEQARDTIRHTGDTRLLTYTLGFLCHFILDSNCHRYIYEKIKDGKVSHSELETEFDRLLMEQCRINPLHTNTTEHLSTNIDLCRLISRIFVPLTPEQIQFGLHSVKIYHHILSSPSPSLRSGIRRLLRLTHTEYLLGGLIVNPDPNPLCRESNFHLLELYQASLKESVSIIQNFCSSISSGKPLSRRFDRTFQM